jgi:hypothetical protein
MADKAAAPTLAHPLVASEATSTVAVITARIWRERMRDKAWLFGMVIFRSE